MTDSYSRRFEDVVNNILAVGDEEVNTHLRSATDWKESERWLKLNECVSNLIPFDCSDYRSVRILAILWGCTEKEVESKLRKYSN